MASAAERNTVWVGFMDTVPVIGTVKEVVEWVLALYEGNKEVVIEKEKAIFQLVREPLDKHMKRLELTEKPEEAGAAASKSALLDIKEVKQNELLVFSKKSQKEPAKVPEEEKPSKVPEEEKPAKVPEEEKPAKVPEEEKPAKVPEEEKPAKVPEEEKPSKAKKKKTAKVKKKKPAKISEKAERQIKIQKLTNDVLIKIRLVEPDYELAELLKEELSRSKQGEHVFNKDILKFHSKTLLLFTKNRIYNLCDNIKQHVVELGKHTLDSNTEDEIQTKMKVDFDEDESYINTNSILYGVYCAKLQNNFHHILQCRDHWTVFHQLKTDLESIINYMNNNEIYVDQYAKVKWINNNRAKRERFANVKGKVVTMYKNKRGWDWIINVRDQLTPIVGFMHEINY